MTALERLLTAGYHLDVFKWDNGHESGIGVHFLNCEIKDGMFLVSDFGRGTTIEEACEDYIKKIIGKLLVFNACQDCRKEVKIIFT